MERRTLVRWILSAATTFPFHRLRLRAQGAALPAESAATLREVAAVVLPGSLGRRGTDDIADRFVQWVRNYKAGAEMDHGYGFTRLRVTADSPAPAYVKQLAALEAAARARGHGLAQLDPPAKRVIVGSAIAAARIENLPGRPNGQHVATDLMSLFFRSSEANDLCYQADIGRYECRGLPGSEAAPAKK